MLEIMRRILSSLSSTHEREPFFLSFHTSKEEFFLSQIHTQKRTLFFFSSAHEKDFLPLFFSCQRRSLTSLKDHAPNVSSSSDKSEVRELLNFGPFRVAGILCSKDLEVLHLRYQISSEFRLEIASPGEQIALLP